MEEVFLRTRLVLPLFIVGALAFATRDGLAGYVEQGSGRQRGGFGGKIAIGQSVQIKELRSSQSLVERRLSNLSFVTVSQLRCWLQAFP